MVKFFFLGLVSFELWFVVGAGDCSRLFYRFLRVWVHISHMVVVHLYIFPLAGAGGWAEFGVPVLLRREEEASLSSPPFFNT